ncbi:MAG: hypothetical protein KAS93_03245 [Gammaproteobacteria bacterium]|nr:hypothetical protein [Gammaproteobacteria bacterium]
MKYIKVTLALFFTMVLLSACSLWDQSSTDNTDLNGEAPSLHMPRSSGGGPRTARVREYYPIPTVVHKNMGQKPLVTAGATDATAQGTDTTTKTT